jgi:uncharacterized membrane protein
MLTQQEKDFIIYWEQNRLKQKRTFRQLLVGIPIGFLFVIPILVNFISGWYKRADMIANTNDFNPLVLIIALLLIIAFIAIFSKHHQWEMREQRYRELIAKQSFEDKDAAITNDEK